MPKFTTPKRQKCSARVISPSYSLFLALGRRLLLLRKSVLALTDFREILPPEELYAYSAEIILVRPEWEANQSPGVQCGWCAPCKINNI